MDWPDDVLTRAPRGALAYLRGRDPLLVPVAFWWDGKHVWLLAGADDPHTQALQHDPACALWVAPTTRGGDGVAGRGRARLFTARDPAALALHGAAITAAVGALGVKHAGALVGYAQDVARLPVRRLLRERVVVRVALEDLQPLRPPPLGTGIAPALPPVIPAEVRRSVAGKRHVTLAVGGDGLQVTPAVWSAGFRVQTPAGVTVPRDAPAAVLVDGDAARRPSDFVAITLAGGVVHGRFTSQLATWWHGFDVQQREVPTAVEPLRLPD